MRFRIDRSSELPAYVQIRNQLREQIMRGDLPSGSRLPPERELARLLGVSRTTVVSAYDELMADGLVEARPGRGTLIAPPGLRWGPGGGTVQPIAWPAHVASLAQRLQRSTAVELLGLGRSSAMPGMISFAAGTPDLRLIPEDRLHEAWEAVLSRMGTGVLGNTPLPGAEPLREVVAARMRARGIQVDPDGVMVIQGSTQGLDLLIRLLTEPGDAVIVEAPTYFGALMALQAQGLRVIGVPVDRDGMLVDQVEFLLARYRPRLIYTVPTFQNPTGVAMSAERREKLLALAVRYQVPIVEDDPFGELHFEPPSPSPIKALDRSGHVLYLGTFSKSLAPGLRVGWLVAPRPVLDLAVLLRRVDDLQPNSLSQYLVTEFITRGWFDEHLTVARAAYAARCRAMDEALRRSMPSDCKWRAPSGGIFLWLEFPAGVAADDLLTEAEKKGVVFLPGRALYPGNPARNACRLNFSLLDEPAIHRGVATLGTVVRQVIRRGVPALPVRPAASAIV